LPFTIYKPLGNPPIENFVTPHLIGLKFFVRKALQQVRCLANYSLYISLKTSLDFNTWVI